MWERSEVSQCDMELEVIALAGREASLRLRGKVAMESRAGDRTYRADLYGDVTCDLAGETFTRFDLLALGTASGAGTYTPGCPPGQFPIAHAFALADPGLEASRVPPQGARSLTSYLAAGR
jgi:hypothetical protein